MVFKTKALAQQRLEHQPLIIGHPGIDRYRDVLPGRRIIRRNSLYIKFGRIYPLRSTGNTRLRDMERFRHEVRNCAVATLYAAARLYINTGIFDRIGLDCSCRELRQRMVGLGQQRACA